MDLAAALPDVLHLEVGEPDFATPGHIVEAAVAAARAGFTHYTPNAGLPELRDAIASVVSPLHGRPVAREQVVVTSGSVCGLMTSLMALLEPGEEVLLPDPGWPNYEMMVVSLGAVPVRYRLAEETGYVPDPSALGALIGPKTKAILLNSPSNPTGAVFDEAVVRGLMELAAAHDLYIVSDEVYDQLIFEGHHVSPARCDRDGRVISIYSFSKTYAMTGWRVGYVVAPPAIAGVITKLQEPVVSCPSAVAQKAAEAAIAGPQTCVTEMRDAYRRRRDAVVAILDAAGVRATVPRGAFYVLVDVASVAHDTFSFARRLLQEERVAVAPGETFGAAGRGRVRISLAADQRVLEEGVRRLAAALTRSRPAS